MAGLPAEPPVVVLLVIWNWEVIWKARGSCARIGKKEAGNFLSQFGN